VGHSTSTPGYWAGITGIPEFAKGAKSVTFTPALPFAGSYEVVYPVPGKSHLCGHTPVEIVHAAGATTIVVNRKPRERVELWALYRFETGAAGAAADPDGRNRRVGDRGR